MKKTIIPFYVVILLSSCAIQRPPIQTEKLLAFANGFASVEFCSETEFYSHAEVTNFTLALKYNIGGWSYDQNKLYEAILNKKTEFYSRLPTSSASEIKQYCSIVRSNIIRVLPSHIMIPLNKEQWEITNTKQNQSIQQTVNSYHK